MSLNFNEHFELLRKILEVNPKLKTGDSAKKHIRRNEGGEKTKGAYTHEDNTVAIINVDRIGTLAHEMRHAWQFKNREEKKFKFYTANDKKRRILKKVMYYVSKKELDANIYARHYCKAIGLNDSARKYLFNLSMIWIMRFCILIFILFAIIILSSYFQINSTLIILSKI